MQVDVKNEVALKDLALTLAADFKPGDFICLRGTLGAGKTSLVRALIRALSGDDTLEVPSPTYTLVQQYDTPQALIWHFDLYRLEDPQEIWELGWEDASFDGLCFVEWPERAGDYLPEDRLEIVISIPQGAPDSRALEFKPYGVWTKRSLSLTHA